MGELVALVARCGGSRHRYPPFLPPAPACSLLLFIAMKERKVELVCIENETNCKLQQMPGLSITETGGVKWGVQD